MCFFLNPGWSFWKDRGPNPNPGGQILESTKWSMKFQNRNIQKNSIYQLESFQITEPFIRLNHWSPVSCQFNLIPNPIFVKIPRKLTIFPHTLWLFNIAMV